MRNLYVFDFFGVVVSDVSTLWMNKHFTPEQQQYARKEIYRKVDCGEMSFDKSFELLAAMCDMTAKEVRREWDSCMYPNRDVAEIILSLRSSGHATALLSNASKQYVDFLFQSYGLNGLFDKTFVSANYGVAKPDRKLYEICLNYFKEPFGAVYFTDDNPKNLVVPESLGLVPVLFTSAEQLKKDLKL